MKTIEYFLELRFRFKEVETHRTFEVSLEELSEVLVCSTRNVKRLLKNMEKEGLIYWKPGGGRGKRSKLHFKRSLKEALLSHVKDLVQRGKYKEAMGWIKREGLPAHVREACYKIMLKEFSFPRIPWADFNRMKEQSSGEFKPILISSSSGRWMFVEGGMARSQTAPFRTLRFPREVDGRRERE
jgi:hypothetical protein